MIQDPTIGVICHYGFLPSKQAYLGNTHSHFPFFVVLRIIILTKGDGRQMRQDD